MGSISGGGAYIKYGISREDFRRAWRTGMWFRYRGAGGGGRREECRPLEREPRLGEEAVGKGLVGNARQRFPTMRMRRHTGSMPAARAENINQLSLSPSARELAAALS